MHDSAATHATVPGDAVDLIVTTANLPGWLAPPRTDELRDSDVERRARHVTVHLAADRATDAIIGLATSDGPSEVAAVTALRMAMSDKAGHARRAGTRSGWNLAVRPATVVVDPTRLLPSKRLCDGLLALGVGVAWRAGAPPRCGGLADRLDDVLRTARWPRVAVAGAFPAVTEVAQLALVRWAVDEHNVAPDVDGSTPASAWECLADAYSLPALPDRDELRHALGMDVRRPVGRAGISLFGHHYQHPALWDAARRRGPFTARVRYDEADAGRVSVEVDGAWISVRCATSGLDGKPVQASRDWTVEAPRRLLEPVPRRPAPGPTDADDACRRVRRLTRAGVDAARAVARTVERADSGVVVAFPGVRLDRDGRPSTGRVDAPSRDEGGDA